MATDDLSLLFKLRGDNAQLKSAIADSRTAVATLKQSLGPELSQTLAGTNKIFSEIGDNLNAFIGQRIPLVGGAFLRITSNLKSFNDELKEGGPRTAALSSQIDSIAKSSGKTSTEVARFLTTFTRLEGQAARNEAAFKFFGGSVDLIGNKTAKFLPELEQTAGALAEVGAEGATAGASLGALAGPVGIAALAVLALAAAAAAAARELISVTKSAADFQGKLFDLAQQTGLSVKTLSALEVAAKTTGGELGSITQAVVLFQRHLDEAQDPLSKTAEQFRKLGVDTSDTETSLRSAFAALARMPEGFAQTNAAAELFGARGGKQVLAILKETNGDIDGTIKRLEQLSILITDDAARSADILNDQLAILDFQTRALSAAFARDLIPVLTDLARTTGELITTFRPLISLLGSATGSAARFTSEQFKSLSVVVQALTKDYVGLGRAIQAAHDAQNITPLTVPAVGPTPLPGAPSALQASGEAVAAADAVLAEVKRKATQTNQALDELFQRGRVDRQRQTLSIIDDNKRILEADKVRIDALLIQKEREIQALDEAGRKRGEAVNRETDQYRAINAAVAKLQQERLDKESEFEVTARALRARAAQESADSLRAEIQNRGDIFVKETEASIVRVEAEIKRGVRGEAEGLSIIDQLEQERAQSRIDTLEKQRAVGFLTIQEQTELNNRLTALQQERDQLDESQSARRLQREAEAATRSRDIAVANLDAIIQQEQIVGERRIETVKALAAQRIITEEAAARQILAIRLSLLDDEIAATNAKLTATKAIADKDEHVRAQTELNNQLKIFKEQRVTIEANGNREIDEKRQEDLDNERKYAGELADIKQRISDIERDAAAEVIRLMVLHFARREDIIRAQRDLDLADEAARHQRAAASISAQQGEVDEQIRIIERHLKSLKIGTTEEIEQYERLIAELEKLRIKRDALNTQQGAEKSRSDTRQRGINDQADAALERENPLSTRSLFGDSFKEQFDAFKQAAIEAGKPISDLRANIEALAQSAADAFAQMSADTGNFASFAGEAFGTLAQGLGQIVESYVLLGETGPAVLRKLLAQILAHLAAEAAVKAIFELAEGFALLFFDPVAAGAHFTAAALYGSVAGVAAVAGRAVAGDLFKPKQSATGSGGGAGSRSSSTQSSQPHPVNLDRVTTQPQKDVVEIRFTGDLADVIEAKWIQQYHGGGRLRNIVRGDQES